MTETANHYSQYLEALNRCCEAVEKAAYHTKQCAKNTEKTTISTYLAAHYAREVLEIYCSVGMDKTQELVYTPCQEVDYE